MEKKQKIQSTIEAFEAFNKLKISNYISDDSELEIDCQHDNYIGQDIFERHIEEWLEFFQEKDQEIFLKLLRHYRYYTQNKVKLFLKQLLQKVCQEDMIDGIYFITFPSKNGIKSGGDNLRALLTEVGIGKIKRDQVISDTEKNMNCLIEKAKHIVFLDDVVGSGKTLYGNLKKCIERLNHERNLNIKMTVAILYGREKTVIKKLKQIEKLGAKIQVFLGEAGEKCFDEADIFSKEEAKIKKDVVIQYEELLKKPEDEQSYVLGFENCQMLLSLFYNTPNNTLSTFWKPSEKNSPLFIRNDYTRPKIDSLRRKKKNNQENAYIKGSLEKCENENG